MTVLARDGGTIDLIRAANGRYIDIIVIPERPTIGFLERRRASGSFGRRILALILLVSVALAPAVARAHLRVSAHPTPQQENARFRWSNSCERVPPRLAADNHVAPILVVPFALPTISSPRHYSWPDTEVVRLVSSDIAPPGLRAPPSLAL